MKRLFVALLITLLSITSCQKYNLSKGLYFAETNLSGGTASWWFGGNLGAGIIKGDKFTIKAQRLYLTGLEYHYLTFNRH